MIEIKKLDFIGLCLVVLATVSMWMMTLIWMNYEKMHIILIITTINIINTSILGGMWLLNRGAWRLMTIELLILLGVGVFIEKISIMVVATIALLYIGLLQDKYGIFKLIEVAESQISVEEN